MEVFRTKTELLAWRAEQRDSVGFVPTMGALHAGHLSLVEASKAQDSRTIVSIFVNPTQFAPHEDFAKYPRDLERDLALCCEAGVDAVFVPDSPEIYGAGFSNDETTTIAPPPHLEGVFEGRIRPGHFRGVLLVLSKFFALAAPTNAYFGKKDAQQLLVVQKMVRDLFVPLNIVGCEIVRDENGLALSSRNAYLSAADYQNALKIPRTIRAAKEAFAGGESRAKTIENLAREALLPLEIDYCDVVDLNLQKIERAKSGESILLVAAKVGAVRLLDNHWF